MEQSVYKIGEVSARLGLIDKNNNTLRTWTEEFGEFLSASANPPTGLPRRYTQRDVQVLAAVREYRVNHLSYDELRDRLRAGELDVTGPDAAHDHDRERDRDRGRDDHSGTDPWRDGASSASASAQALTPLNGIETLLAPLVASVDEWRRLSEEYRTRLEGREARIEVLERRVEDLYERLDHARPRAQVETQVHPPATSDTARAHAADDHRLAPAEVSVPRTSDLPGTDGDPPAGTAGVATTRDGDVLLPVDAYMMAAMTTRTDMEPGNAIFGRPAGADTKALDEPPLFPLPTPGTSHAGDTLAGPVQVPPVPGYAETPRAITGIPATVARSAGHAATPARPARPWWRIWRERRT